MAAVVVVAMAVEVAVVVAVAAVVAVALTTAVPAAITVVIMATMMSVIGAGGMVVGSARDGSQVEAVRFKPPQNTCPASMPPYASEHSSDTWSGRSQKLQSKERGIGIGVALTRRPHQCVQFFPHFSLSASRALQQRALRFARWHQLSPALHVGFPPLDRLRRRR